MKQNPLKYALTILVLLLANPIHCSPGNYDDPMNKPPISLVVQELCKNGAVVVQISSLSAATVRLWENSNSWGWSNWRIIVIRRAAVFLIVRNPSEVFTRNIPAYHEIQSFQKKTEILNINDGSWRCDGRSAFSFERGDELVVLYDSPQTAEGKKAGVWTGARTAYYKYD